MQKRALKYPHQVHLNKFVQRMNQLYNSYLLRMKVLLILTRQLLLIMKRVLLHHVQSQLLNCIKWSGLPLLALVHRLHHIK